MNKAGYMTEMIKSQQSTLEAQCYLLKTFGRNEKYAVGHTVLWHIFMSVCAHPVCILIKEAKMDKHVSVARDRIS